MGAALPLGAPVPRDGSLPGAVIEPTAPLSAYVHIPFCRVRCGYCDFNTYTAQELHGAPQDAYAETVRREITLSAAQLAARGPLRPATTVFLGGGTPTLLPAGDLGRMLHGVAEEFGIAPDAEVTVEANPDTVVDGTAEALAAAGVTRMSVGMQSAVPHVLASLDRTHRPENVRSAVNSARAAGLQVSVDVIYGAPGEALEDWRRSLDAALALEPDHISAYALIVEDGTKLARQTRRGEVVPPDDGEAGYDWYEVSTWARTPDSRSRHNLAYWEGADWWGYGPGAHSHIAGTRFWNVRHPAAYAARLAAGESPAAGRETPDATARRWEEVLLRTRIREGLPVERLSASGRRALAALIADGLVDGAAAVHGRVVLTLRGRLLGDTVARALTS